MTIESDLQQFISAEVALDPGEGGIKADEPLISTGKVDSMGLLQILGFIQQRYGIDLMATSGPRDFESVASLAAAIRRARGEG